jgi:energy-coupling factor transporter ATP-binding protein EcfA2
MNKKAGASEQTAASPRGKAAALTELDRLRLLQAVSRYFSEEELRTLCYELEIDYDDLPARGKTNKARELIFHCERTRRLDDLITLCQEKRPLVDWPTFVRPNLDTLAPFKGLAFYDVADASLFYGREALTSELVEHLRHHRFLAVVGASGSGKSSVVRAGLIPALQGKLPPDFGGELPAGSLSWPTHIFTPTSQPLKELATRLTMESESVRATTQLIDDMIQEPRSLDIALTRLASQLPAERILLVIDQFEELFTLCHDEAEQQAFIDNLVTAVTPEATGPGATNNPAPMGPANTEPSGELLVETSPIETATETPTILAPSPEQARDTPTTTITPIPALTFTPTATEIPHLITLQQMNLRAGPGVSYAPVGGLPQGARANVIGRNQAADGLLWWRIECPAGVTAGQCWISGGHRIDIGCLDWDRMLIPLPEASVVNLFGDVAMAELALGKDAAGGH